MDDDMFIIPSDDILIGEDTGAFINGDESILSESESIVGPPGPPGPKGDAGDAATITVGSTTTGAAGTNASVVNSGTSSAAVLDFTIPRGAAGVNGSDGFSPIATVSQNTGSATISITDANGTTTATVSDGSDGLDGYSPIAAVEQTEFGATITITDSNGTTTADVVNGSTGPQGPAATITVGSTTTGAAGTNASVVNSGTSSAAVLDFTIPRGSDGTNGSDGFSPIATVSQNTGSATISITDANGTTTATVYDGATGSTGPQGPAATITVGSTTTGAAGTSASVTNSGTSSAAILDFVIPKGDSGVGITTLTDNAGREGYYFDDGLLICRRTVSFNVAINTAWGSLYRGVNPDYYSFIPSGADYDFISKPTVSITSLAGGTSSYFMGAWENGAIVKTGQWNVWAIPTGSLSFLRPNISSSTPVLLEIIAIGKWK